MALGMTNGIFGIDGHNLAPFQGTMPYIGYPGAALRLPQATRCCAFGAEEALLATAPSARKKRPCSTAGNTVLDAFALPILFAYFVSQSLNRYNLNAFRKAERCDTALGCCRCRGSYSRGRNR